MLRRLRLLALFVGCLTALTAARAQTIQTIAPWAILVDAETGSVLFEKGADEPMSPASMVKVFTAEMAFHELRQGRMSLDDTMVISDNAWRRGGAASGGALGRLNVASHVASPASAPSLSLRASQACRNGV